MDDNYNLSIPKWVDENYPRILVYHDAQVNVLEEALLISTNNKSRRIEKDRKNPKHKSYNFKDLAKLAQTLSRIYVFCRSRKHIITECL